MQVESKATQLRDALVRIGGIADPPHRTDRAGSVAVPLPEQDGVLVHADAGRAHARPPQGRPLGRGARDRALLADDRPRQRDPERRSRLGARGRAGRVRPGGAEGLSPPPRHPRRPQHGAGAGDARDRTRREVRDRLFRRGAAPLPRGAVDPLGDQRHAVGGDEPAIDAALGRGRDRGGAARPPVPTAPERVPADEHGDGGAALRACSRVRGADRHRDGVRPLLRHGHDRAQRSRGTRSVSGVSRSPRSRWPARSRTPS